MNRCSTITSLEGKDWWIQVKSKDGKQKYPDQIRVGSLDNPRIYVQERTCHVVWNEMDDTWECDWCGSAVGFKGVSYCESCGAKVVDDDDN